jgi:hypothetical protein
MPKIEHTFDYDKKSFRNSYPGKLAIFKKIYSSQKK